MKSLKTILIIFSVLSPTLLCQNVGQWRNYSSMKNISATVNDGTGIWAATDGGAFRFIASDSSFSTVTKADGLISQSLTSIGLDNTNKVWTGTKEGYINVFDQQNNSVRTIIDIFQSGKTQKQINNIFIKSDTAFVSTDFGLSIINTSTLSFYDTFIKLGSFQTESKIISAFKSNLIFAITEYGVAVQKEGATNLSAPESWDTYKFGIDIPAVSAKRILSFNGQILLATSAGVFQFVNKSWQSYTLQENKIIDMTAFGNILNLITANQLFQYSNGQITKLYENMDVTFNSVTATSNQSIYISSNSGLIEFISNKTRILFPNGPTNNSFMNLAVDPSSNLWVATGTDAYGVGFLKFDGTTWKTYDKASYPQLPSNAYHNVYAAPDSAIYLSNWGNGITILKNNIFQIFTADNSSLIGIPNNNKFLVISDCKTDSKGNLWVLNTQSASRKPLSVYPQKNPWIHFSFSNPPLTEIDNLDKLIIDQYDTKWFTVTINGREGLYYFNENKTLDNSSDDIQGYLNLSNNLLSDLITALAIDARGYLWIGTNVGINVIAGVDVRTDPTKVKVTSNLGVAVRNQTVTCIAIDPLDQKWIGTKQGVFVLSSDGIQLVNQYSTKNSPLPSDDIKSIAFDSKNGIAYIGTDYGLAALQTASIQPPESFNEVFVYPNPFVISDDGSQLTIEGLIKNSSIRIFNISGNLIRDFKSPGGKIAFWDGKDLDGNLVPTGIYIIVAYDEEANNVKTSKVAVIKK